MIRIVAILLVMVITAGCTILGDSSPEIDVERTLNTPIVVKEKTPVQKVEITKQADDQQPESAPTVVPTQAVIRADLENLGPAPELVNETWINTEGPLRLANLGGRVVLLEMWTFG